MITSFLDVKQTVLSKSHYLLYGLAAAVQPRMLVTFDSELRPLPVSVRVGQAVDVVGQAGKPKTITGFQVRGCLCAICVGIRGFFKKREDKLLITEILVLFVFTALVMQQSF